MMLSCYCQPEQQELNYVSKLKAHIRAKSVPRRLMSISRDDDYCALLLAKAVLVPVPYLPYLLSRALRVLQQKSVES